MTAPKILLTSLALAGSALAAPYHPTQTDLQAYLGIAAAKWGLYAEVRAIKLGEMNSCRGKEDLAALSEFGSRVITINSACRWTRQRLLGAIVHEYGHLLAGDANHDPSDKHSVMYYRLGRGQKITNYNRSYIKWAEDQRKVRPSILIGGLD